MSKSQVSKADAELAVAEQELLDCRKKIAELRKNRPVEKVNDYTLRDGQGNEVALSSLFSDKGDLIVVHNMGKGCSYCTLWADGFNGVYQHLEDRAGFVLVSPDAPKTMSAFAGGRGWKFKTLSNDGGTFTSDMGYENPDGTPQPGISTFHRDADGQITRIAHASLGPGDDFCSAWHIFDMLKAGPDGWEPKYEY